MCKGPQASSATVRRLLREGMHPATRGAKKGTRLAGVARRVPWSELEAELAHGGLRAAIRGALEPLRLPPQLGRGPTALAPRPLAEVLAYVGLSEQEAEASFHAGERPRAAPPAFVLLGQETVEVEATSLRRARFRF